MFGAPILPAFLEDIVDLEIDTSPGESSEASDALLDLSGSLIPASNSIVTVELPVGFEETRPIVSPPKMDRTPPASPSSWKRGSFKKSGDWA
jgi:hypothetical protein